MAEDKHNRVPIFLYDRVKNRSIVSQVPARATYRELKVTVAAKLGLPE